MRRLVKVAGISIGVIAVLVVAGGVAIFGTAEVKHQQAAAQLRPFYDPPNPLPKGQPGTLIRSEPVSGPAGVKSWRILYHSTTLTGQDVAVSALVIVPDKAAPAGGFPVVSVAHGTVGVARTCAPSLQPFNGDKDNPSFYDTVLKWFTDAGYAVVATDYRGLGTPGVQPYLVGVDAGHNVLDAARAIHQLPGLSLSNQLLIWGHSQGGQAAAFAAQLAPSYAPEIHLLGTVAGSPAVELQAIANTVTHVTGRSLVTGLMVIISNAWSQTYPDLSLDSVLTGAGKLQIGVLNKTCISGALLSYMLLPAPKYIKAEGIKQASWPKLLAQNTPGDVKLSAPILVFQGETDPLILPAYTQTFVQHLCTAGNVVALNLYPGKGHNDVVDPSMPDTITWMADRLAGKPAPSTCTAGR